MSLRESGNARAASIRGTPKNSWFPPWGSRILDGGTLAAVMTTEPPPTPASTPSVTPTISRADEAQTDLAKRYHLILHDDDDHTYQYVIEMLGKVFGYGREKAFAIAGVVDGQGQAVLETDAYDVVTGHQKQIHGYGRDPRIEHCKGSMSATVEEAP